MKLDQFSAHVWKLLKHTNENSFARAFGGAGVRVNAGGDAPPDPPSVVTSWAIPPFFVFSRKDFWRMSGKYFWRGR